MIADLVRYKRYSPSALGDEATEELRNLARYRMSLVERSTALKNRATAILDRTFPELAGLFSNAYCPTRRELLQHCATPDQVLGTDVGTLERILREASRGRCGRAKAERLKALAEASVGVGFGSKTLAFEVRLLMEELDFVQGQIKEVEGELESLLERTRGKWLVTIPGIDVPLASVIAGEIGDPDGFDDPHRLMGYAGMDPTRSESGETVKSDGRMSKRARGAAMGSHAGRRLRQEERPLLRRLLRQEEGRGQEAPLRRPLRRRPQAHGRRAGGDEGGAAATEPTPPKNHRPGHLRGA